MEPIWPTFLDGADVDRLGLGDGEIFDAVQAGLRSERTLHGELCEIVTGAKPGREDDGETTLFWHRGLSPSDNALGAAMLGKAAGLGLDRRRHFA